MAGIDANQADTSQPIKQTLKLIRHILANQIM
jgi:hypothetical protein